MNSQLFREELERVVGDSIRESGADGISALLSDVMNIKSGTAPASACVVPINDIRVYQKVEVLETGTTDPKKITKWVSEGSPSHSTPIKIESSNQFVPVNTNPKEFKKVQKLMKEGRRLGGVHAGPESKVLDGVSWEEARQMADAHPSAVGDPYGMKVGAASKGIIQRDFQHHATVFKNFG